jgi:hypothetical protein
MAFNGHEAFWGDAGHWGVKSLWPSAFAFLAEAC